METKNERRKGTVHHIHRIIGQLKRLETDISQDAPCRDIAMLSASIAKSCQALNMRTLKGFIMHELGSGADDDLDDHLSTLFGLYK